MNRHRWCSCAALVVSAACASRADSARTDTSAGRFDSTAAVAAATMNESAVFGFLDDVNSADSALGALGAARATATEVRDFGRMILREHHALRRESDDLAHRLGLTPSEPRVPPDAPPTVQWHQLSADSSSAAWDRSYIDYAEAAHRSGLENAARALAATRRSETKEYIGQLVPILQKHLDKAQSLQKLLEARARPTK